MQSKKVETMRPEMLGMHHCYLVTIRGNSYRMRQRTDCWQTPHVPQDPEPAARRRRSRQETTTN